MADAIEKSAQKAKKQEARTKRQAERAEKRQEKSSGRAMRLCALSTVEVKKDEEGFEVFVNGSHGRHRFVVAADEVGPVLRDLETAIQVIRGQH